jgi:hypothetical protein
MTKDHRRDFLIDVNIANKAAQLSDLCRVCKGSRPDTCHLVMVTTSIGSIGRNLATSTAAR